MKAETKLKKLQELVDLQAGDEGLWFIAETASEAYLQQELRRLHAAIESNKVDILINNYKEILHE